jgi:hypothetical protein
MSSALFGPVEAAFRFCVMFADPVASELMVWDWLSGPGLLFGQDQLVPLPVAFSTLLLPEEESCVMEIDW